MAEVTRFEAVGGIEAVELSWDIKAYGVIKYLLLEVGAEGGVQFYYFEPDVRSTNWVVLSNTAVSFRLHVHTEVGPPAASETITVRSTPVATITRFEANPVNVSIELDWDIDVSGEVDGIYLERVKDGPSLVSRIPATGLWNASTRSYVDREVVPGTQYTYTINVVESGNGVPRVVASRAVVTTVNYYFTDLEQNHPNPFNPGTTIRYTIRESGIVRLQIFDTRGRRVRTLVNDLQQPGRKTVEWQGIDDRGNSVASGIYYYRLDAGQFSRTRKLVLVR